MLYTTVGATFGQAFEVLTDRKFMFQRHIARIKPARSVICPTYLVHTLNSPRCYKHAQEVARGAAQPTVNLSDLRQYAVLVPPLAEQHEIVRRVEALFAQADKIEARVAAATLRVEKITQAILAKAFRGELVPTEAELARAEGRDYEPANVLLERIRAECEAGPASSASGSRRRSSKKRSSDGSTPATPRGRKSPF